MKKQEQIKKQTWKFFWQQKFQEIGRFFGVVFGIYLLPIIMNKTGLTRIVLVDILEDSLGKYMWVDGLLALLIMVLILSAASLLLYALYLVGTDWIEENWERAELRAEVEYKVNRTTKR